MGNDSKERADQLAGTGAKNSSKYGTDVDASSSDFVISAFQPKGAFAGGVELLKTGLETQ